MSGVTELRDRTYKVKVACLNCFFEGETRIAKGVTVGEATCPYCSCKGFMKPLEAGWNTEDATKTA